MKLHGFRRRSTGVGEFPSVCVTLYKIWVSSSTAPKGGAFPSHPRHVSPPNGHRGLWRGKEGEVVVGGGGGGGVTAAAAAAAQ